KRKRTNLGTYPAPEIPSSDICLARLQPEHDWLAGQVDRYAARICPASAFRGRADRVEAPGERDRLTHHHVQAVGGGGDVALRVAVPDADVAPEDERVAAVRGAQQQPAHVASGALEADSQAAR